MYQRPKWECGRERQLSLVSLFCLTGLTSSDFHFELLNFTLVVSLAPGSSLPVSVPGTLRMPLYRLYKLSSEAAAVSTQPGCSPACAPLLRRCVLPRSIFSMVFSPLSIMQRRKRANWSQFQVCSLCPVSRCDASPVFSVLSALSVILPSKETRGWGHDQVGGCLLVPPKEKQA